MGYILLRSLRPVVRINTSQLNHSDVNNHKCLTIESVCSTIQSEKVATFAMLMCKQLNPSSPSIHQVKSIRLPGYTEPSKVRIKIILT